MLGFRFDKFVNETAQVSQAVHRSLVRTLAKSAYAIFRAAQASIVVSPQPSKPGEPPHSRKGQLPRAIRYDVEQDLEQAVIGPRASMIGGSAEPEEFGGGYRGGSYPQRSFMGPALKANAHLLPAGMAGDVTNQ